jgi:hypothetical protein
MIFYYFLPQLTCEQVVEGELLRRDVLAAAGLAEILADVRKVPAHAAVNYVRTPVGPGKQVGTVISPVSKAHGSGFVGNDPAKQRWVPGPLTTHHSPPTPAYWVGSLIGNPPTPPDLERWSVLGGAIVTDKCGWEWRVPIARAPQQPFGSLPQTYTFDAAGEPQPHLDPAYQWLWDLAGEIRNWYVRAAGPPEDATPAEQAAYVPPKFAELVKHAARILQVNYRVGPLELNLLHELGRPVLSQLLVHGICQACYGWEIEDEAKKKPLAESSSPAASSSP